MKISFNWLKQYLPIELDYEKVSEILTDTGLEVEGITHYQSVQGGMENIVIGHVLACRKHPDADRLTVTTVDTGEESPLQIVCGAPNVEPGQKVAVALVGSTLYINDQEVKIKKSKIRGEISEGMICAEDELGLGDDHDGIVVLNNDALPGTRAADYFQIENDIVFEIGLTPNRIDAASHYGVARDLAARLGQENPIKLTRTDVSNFKPDNNNKVIDIIIEDSNACRRYSGLTISDIKVESSPEWLQNRLKAIGLKPINNIVDITNYVLHETGQPLHAFDADKIKGNKVIVKQLAENTKFVALDEKEYNLSNQDLMICNETEGMCIAGIFGGIDSGVTSRTTSLFLESAWFDPVSIRRSAKRFGLSTDASFRFERGADPEITVYALKRAALLIKEVAGGNISSNVIDLYPNPVEPVKLNISFSYINNLIGTEIPSKRIIKILELLDFNIIETNNHSIIIEPPLYRSDVKRDADVVEEILRIYGYNNIKSPDSVHSNLSWSIKPDREKYSFNISEMLSGNGFSEIMSNSLTRSSYYENSKTFSEANLVKIVNPLSGDLNCMRQNLLFGGLEAISHNVNRQNPDLNLYEFGNIYSFTGDDNQKKDLSRYKESFRLALFITTSNSKKFWNSKLGETTFFDLKGHLYQIFRRTGIDPDMLTTRESENDLLEYGLRFESNKQLVAEAGSVNPDIIESAGIKTGVMYAEIDWNRLINIASKIPVKFNELPKFPEVRRDLAMELNTEIKFETIKKIALNSEKRLLKSVSLFDIYTGSKIESGKKSYAISFILRDHEGTLKDKQIDAAMQRLEKAFETEAGARIRR